MAQEYKITKISQDEPREWESQYGKTYYIKVKLDGHNRAVEIGKKKPDALKEGDTVFGTIIPNDGFPTDKFKAEQNPSYAHASTASYKRPVYKDNSDGMRQGMCFNNAANYVNAHYPKLDAETWADNVYKYATELYVRGDLGKPEQTSLKDAWAKTTARSEEESLDQVVDYSEGEPISLDEIPF